MHLAVLRFKILCKSIMLIAFETFAKKVFGYGDAFCELYVTSALVRRKPRLGG